MFFFPYIQLFNIVRLWSQRIPWLVTNFPRLFPCSAQCLWSGAHLARWWHFFIGGDNVFSIFTTMISTLWVLSTCKVEHKQTRWHLSLMVFPRIINIRTSTSKTEYISLVHTICTVYIFPRIIDIRASTRKTEYIPLVHRICTIYIFPRIFDIRASKSKTEYISLVRTICTIYILPRIIDIRTSSSKTEYISLVHTSYSHQH